MRLLARTITRSALAGALLVGVPALVPLGLAQVTVSPAVVEASLPAGQRGEISLTVKNEGDAPVDLFAVPLPEEGVPVDVGELLFSTEPGVIGDPYDLAMTSEGRLFVARYGGGRGYTWEFTPALDSLRIFENPRVDNSSFTTGIAWMPPDDAPPGHEEGTLWWMDVAVDCDLPHCTVENTLLIEGDLDGHVTGRTIELVTGPGYSGPGITYDRGVSFGHEYDAAERLFYYLDTINEDIYAIDLGGEVAQGFPVPETDYDEGAQMSLGGNSLDISPGYAEMTVTLPQEEREMRVVVTDRQGRNTGVETPLDLLRAPDGVGDVVDVEGVLRSRLDPSVMYLSVLTGIGADISFWVVAIRAAPLPPRWLRASPVAPHSLALAPGETDTLTVRLNAEGMAPGVYEGQVSLRKDDPNGEEAASVPVTLTVTEGTAVEPGAPQQDEALRVWPNPASGLVRLGLTLPEAAEVAVAVYDVLGRCVATLAEGRVEAGSHRLPFDASMLPAGIYVVRAEIGGVRTPSQRLTVVR